MVLSRYGGALDLAIASPVANRHGPDTLSRLLRLLDTLCRASGRPRPAVEPLMGYFVSSPKSPNPLMGMSRAGFGRNTVIFRIALQPPCSFEDTETSLLFFRSFKVSSLSLPSTFPECEMGS